MTLDSPLPPTTDCARFEAQLGPWLEHDLDTDAQAFMTRHRARCAACAALADDLDGLVAAAAALPSLSPPRDLWQGIEARLEAPVVPLAQAPSAPPSLRQVRPGRSVSVRTFAIAATLLVAVSSGVTWQLARARSEAGAGGPGGPASPGTVAASPANGPILAAESPATAGDAGETAEPLAGAATAELVVGSAAALPRPVRLASSDDVDAPAYTYEREIGALRQIVDERFAELDSVTVAELRRNLDIIDRAIADSRRALARDPRSALLSTQLDRALEAKLDLLRRVALL